MPKTSLLGYETTTGKQGELLLVDGELKVSASSSGVVGDKTILFGGAAIPGVGIFANHEGTANFKCLKVDSSGHLLTAVDSSADSIQVLGNTNKDGSGTKYHIKLNSDGNIENVPRYWNGSAYVAGEINAANELKVSNDSSNHTPSQAFSKTTTNLTCSMMATNGSNQYQQLRVNSQGELQVSGADNAHPSNITSSTSAAVATTGTPSTTPKMVICGPELNANPTLINPMLVQTDGSITNNICAIDTISSTKKNITATTLNSKNRLDVNCTLMANTQYSGGGPDIFLNVDTGLAPGMPDGALNVHDTFNRYRLEDSANPISIASTNIVNSTTITINNVDLRSAAGGGNEGAYKAKKMTVSISAVVTTVPVRASVQIIGFSGNADVHNYDVVVDDRSQWTKVGQVGGVNCFNMINGSIDVLHDKYFVRIDNQETGTIQFYVNYYIGG